MACPLRIERLGERYVTARGNERKATYRTDEDRFHFPAVLEKSGPTTPRRMKHNNELGWSTRTARVGLIMRALQKQFAFYPLKTNLFHRCPLVVALLLALNTSAQTITQIASSQGVSFFVKSDGSLWRGDVAHALAKHTERMQSLSDELKQHPELSAEINEKKRQEAQRVYSFEPVEPVVPNGVTAVAMNGQGGTFFIKRDGSLWAMGNNWLGYLGDGSSVTPDHPIQLVPSGVVAVACGESFTIFLKDDGSVWGFGWNDQGALGDGSENTTIRRPKQFIDGGVSAIAAGTYHSLFIKRDGSLWGAGGNGCGQLGLGKEVLHALRPTQILASDVVSVAAGDGHTLIIKRDGSLWATGENNAGQLGDGGPIWVYRPKQTVANDVVAATAGRLGSLFLKKDGSLWGMGVNWGSDFGEGIEFDFRFPTQIFAGNNSSVVAGSYYNARLKTCASIWAAQFNNNPGALGPVGNQTEPGPTGNIGLASSSAGLPGYNLITIEQLTDGKVRLTYSGNAGANYALERSSSLANPTWVSLVTNTAASGGVLVITNTPEASTNNFWRIRSVP